jgi:hypothetical protein
MAENHITTRQMDFIEFMIANPLKTAKELCQEYGLSNNTYSTWRRQPKFKEYLSKRLQEKWKDNELMAQATIEQLARDGDFKAAKYILDSLGYAPVQKVQAEVQTSITINVEE